MVTAAVAWPGICLRGALLRYEGPKEGQEGGGGSLLGEGAHQRGGLGSAINSPSRV